MRTDPEKLEERLPISPTTSDFSKRFGIHSSSFQSIQLELTSTLEKIKDYKTVRTKLEYWGRSLEIVYGEPVESVNLFVRHTYLATLAKLILYLHLEGEIPSSWKQITQILDGTFFRNFGLLNFVEEDFFTWILLPELEIPVKKIILSLLQQLLVYDLSLLNEDVFKGLYEELVDPGVRHGLGEYNTPNWLAEYIVKDLLEMNPKASILDPTCGSGTFLFSSIKYIVPALKTEGMNNAKILKHILKNVYGSDIHPLAVIIAKTNYLLSLKDLIRYREDSLSFPIFHADSLRKPVFLSGMKFDFIIGNPPWLSMRYIKDINYQKFVKDRSFHYNLIDKRDVHLFTHLEVATIFLYHSVDYYLKPGGILTFIMPKSVLVSSQHMNFRIFAKAQMALLEVFDLEKVSPLFPVPSCVIKVQKKVKNNSKEKLKRGS
ncbi:MAG: class I SAM-dependent DNA methyltransferase [Promethearchaeota archaeon]